MKPFTAATSLWIRDAAVSISEASRYVAQPATSHWRARAERLAVERFRELVERLERDRRLRQRFRGGDIGVVAPQPFGDGVFPVRSLEGRAPEAVAPAAARQSSRDLSTAAC